MRLWLTLLLLVLTVAPASAQLAAIYRVAGTIVVGTGGEGVTYAVNGQPLAGNRWDTTTVPNGLYTVTARTHDATGAVLGQVSMTFEVLNVAAPAPTPTPIPTPPPPPPAPEPTPPPPTVRVVTVTGTVSTVSAARLHLADTINEGTQAACGRLNAIPDATTTYTPAAPKVGDRVRVVGVEVTGSANCPAAVSPATSVTVIQAAPAPAPPPAPTPQPPAPTPPPPPSSGLSCTRTVQPGQAVGTVRPGDTICFADGTWSGVGTSASGTPTARIRYVALNKWKARVVGDSESAWTNGGDYVDIEGFEITGPRTRIAVSNAGSHVRIRGNWVHDVGTEGGCPGGGGAAIDHVDYGAVNNETSGNLVVRAGPQPPAALCNGYQGIYHSMDGGDIVNNVVIRAGTFGIHFWHAATRTRVYNNLVIGSRKAGVIVGAGDGQGPHSGRPADQMLVANNVIVGNAAECIRDLGAVGGGNRYLNNLCWQNGGGVSVRGQVSGTINADPRFVRDVRDGSGDYHLQAGSPAIDAASSASPIPALDYDGVARPQGRAADLGPFERAP